MKHRNYLLLALLGLSVSLSVAFFQPVSGYMDADYYFAGGLELAMGRGFSEPYIWNYLDDPSSVPHPSHGYWMPLVSIVAAVIPALLGTSSWFVARLPFLIVAIIIPPVTAALAYSLTRQRILAMLSGFLAIFSGFYLPFLTTSDSFGVYMLLGGLFLLIISQRGSKNELTGWVAFALGILTGFMHLSRADGILWLLITLAAIILIRPPGRENGNILLSLLFILAGYLVVMTPWFLRNYFTFGSVLAPNGSKLLWLTSYDQIFSYPASEITINKWWQSGVQEILRVRLWALGMNLATSLTVQGGIFLLPLILIGIWKYRKNEIIKLAVVAWLMTMLVMTLIFPFAGARGGFFHSGAAVQVIWWAMAPVGFNQVMQWGVKHRQWNESKSRSVFSVGLIGLSVFMSISVLLVRLPSWKNEFSTYKKLDQFLTTQGMEEDDVVIVSNPPGFYLSSSNLAIAVPDGTINTILNLRDRFAAEYLILEQGSIPLRLEPIYKNPNDYPDLDFLGEVESVRVFQILP